MDWNLIRPDNEDEERILMTVSIWKSTKEKLDRIAKAENISLSRIMRHSINSFLEEYRKSKKEVV